MVYVWLGVLAVSLVVEFLTMELVSIWISLGAFIAMILAACGVMVEIQLLLFFIVSIACIFGLRKFTLKLISNNKDKTNIDLAIGVRTKLIKAITLDEMGTIKYNGIEYNVKTQKSGNVPAGAYVEIVRVEGNKFIVEPLKEDKQPTETEPQKNTEQVLNKTVNKKNKK